MAGQNRTVESPLERVPQPASVCADEDFRLFMSARVHVILCTVVVVCIRSPTREREVVETHQVTAAMPCGQLIGGRARERTHRELCRPRARAIWQEFVGLKLWLPPSPAPRQGDENSIINGWCGYRTRGRQEMLQIAVRAARFAALRYPSADDAPGGGVFAPGHEAWKPGLSSTIRNSAATARHAAPTPGRGGHGGPSFMQRGAVVKEISPP